MSAGVGRVKSRRSDFYPTPAHVVHDLIKFIATEQSFGEPPLVIDPCAGVGCLLHPWQRRATIEGLELRRDLVAASQDVFASPRIRQGDGLEYLERLSARPIDLSTDHPLPLVVLNPPYSDADRWVKAAVAVYDSIGWRVAILLRSQWLDDGNTKGRGVYRRAMRPSFILRLPYRVSFNGEGADSCCYAWHIWQATNQSTPYTLTVWADYKRNRTTEEKGGDGSVKLWRQAAELSKHDPLERGHLRLLVRITGWRLLLRESDYEIARHLERRGFITLSLDERGLWAEATTIGLSIAAPPLTDGSHGKSIKRFWSSGGNPTYETE